MGKLTQEQFEKNLQSILEYARTTEEPLTLWDLDRKKRDHGPNSLTDDEKNFLFEKGSLRIGEVKVPTRKMWAAHLEEIPMDFFTCPIQDDEMYKIAMKNIKVMKHFFGRCPEEEFDIVVQYYHSLVTLEDLLSDDYIERVIEASPLKVLEIEESRPDLYPRLLRKHFKDEPKYLFKYLPDKTDEDALFVLENVPESEIISLLGTYPEIESFALDNYKIHPILMKFIPFSEITVQEVKDAIDIGGLELFFDTTLYSGILEKVKWYKLRAEVRQYLIDTYPEEVADSLRYGDQSAPEFLLSLLISGKVPSTVDRKTLDLVIKEMTDSGEWYKQRLVAE